MDISSAPTIHPPANETRDAMMRAAKELESQFLAEMLKTAGLGKTPEGFGGAVGEDRFSSLLAEQQARQIVEAGGFGLSEAIFKSMVERNNE